MDGASNRNLSKFHCLFPLQTDFIISGHPWMIDKIPKNNIHTYSSRNISQKLSHSPCKGQTSICTFSPANASSSLKKILIINLCSWSYSLMSRWNWMGFILNSNSQKSGWCEWVVVCEQSAVGESIFLDLPQYYMNHEEDECFRTKLICIINTTQIVFKI
jgi:hypothetical protein